MSVPTSPAARHRRFVQEFSEVVGQVADWDAPTPVAGWSARDVVNHLIAWLPPVVEGASGIRIDSSPVGAGQDPTQAWLDHAAQVQRVLESDAASEVIDEGPFTASTVAEMLDRIYTPDVFMHRWDLARSAGVDADLDETYSLQLLHGMSAMEVVLRDSGHYGPPVAVADDARAEDKLVAFIGRDPDWTALTE